MLWIGILYLRTNAHVSHVYGDTQERSDEKKIEEG